MKELLPRLCEAILEESVVAVARSRLKTCALGLTSVKQGILMHHSNTPVLISALLVVS